MRIIFTSKGDSWDSQIDPRFGRTDFFFIYEEGSEQTEAYDNRAIAGQAHGAGPKTAQKMGEYGAEVLVTGNGPGGNAARVIEKMGIKVFTGAGGMTVREALESYRNRDLPEFGS
jgi:predicted Fe-Mo cluster-binding NifX family protein